MLAKSLEVPSDREIVTTRLFDAPRDLVFQAWVDPKQVAQWWGPKGFTNTIHEMDVQPGGVWRFTMHGPDGTDYANKIIFREITRPERIVYSHVSGPLFELNAEFEEENGQTGVTMRMVFQNAETRDKITREFGAIEGAEQTLARLAEHLASFS